MKFIVSDDYSKNKKRYILALGESELRILHGLTSNACRYMPLKGREKGPVNEYISTARTVRNMNTELLKALKFCEDNNERN